jgi:hypothetical protein
MSAHRFDHAPDPPQLVLGFGNTSQQAIRDGLALLADILKPRLAIPDKGRGDRARRIPGSGPEPP